MGDYAARSEAGQPVGTSILTIRGTAVPLDRTTLEDANRLMMAALAILDRHRQYGVAARLDSAIVELGLRSPTDGVPPENY